MKCSLIKKLIIIINLLIFVSACGPAEFGFGGSLQGQSYKLQDQELVFGEMVTTNQGWNVQVQSTVFLENISYNFWYIEGE